MKKTMFLVVMIFVSFVVGVGERIILQASEDVYITTHVDPPMADHAFLKFNISAVPVGMKIDSVYLQVYVHRVYPSWTGNVVFWNVNSQTWTEADDYRTIWNISTSDLTHQPSGFGMSVGLTKSVDLKTMFLRDYNAARTYTSIKISEYSLQGGDPLDKGDFNDSLSLGFSTPPGGIMSICFRPHEYGDSAQRPYLTVYYSASEVEEESKNLLNHPMLIENSPNPFSHQTMIRISAKVSDGRLNIYDVSGNLIRSLSVKKSSILIWDGKDKNGQEVLPGVYFCRFIIGRQMAERKVIKIE